jgi:hypothetical protein
MNVKNVNDGPMVGAIRDPKASTINIENIDNGPLGGHVRDSGAPTISAKKHW